MNNFFAFCLIILSINLNAQKKKAFFPLKMNSSNSEFFSKTAKVDTTQVSIAISYESTIPIHYISADEQTEWAIFKNKKLLKKGIGQEINHFVFLKPGDYRVTLLNRDKHVSGSCIHPDKFLVVTVKVDEVQVNMMYNQEFWLNLFTYQKIFEKQTVLVPVKINYYKKPVDINSLSLYLSGVNCNLIGKSRQITGNTSNSILLVPFELNGTVGTSVYAMLDFIDQNKNTVSFSITKLIN